MFSFCWSSRLVYEHNNSFVVFRKKVLPRSLVLASALLVDTVLLHILIEDGVAMVRAHNHLCTCHIVFVPRYHKLSTEPVVFLWLITILQPLMSCKHLGLGHCLFTILCSQHLQHFHHQSSQLLVKFRVCPLLQVVHFPTSELSIHCTVLYITCTSLMVIEQFHQLCGDMHFEICMNMLSITIHFCSRTL